MHSGATKPYVPMSTPLEEDIIFVIGGCSYLMREKMEKCEVEIPQINGAIKKHSSLIAYESLASFISAMCKVPPACLVFA